MNNLFFTADTHFDHQRTLELSQRPFVNLNEMNKALVDNWNNTVNDDSFIIHHGDFGNPKFAKELRGHIILIPGNYERDAVKKDPEYYSQFDNTKVLVLNANPDGLDSQIIVKDNKTKIKIQEKYPVELNPKATFENKAMQTLFTKIICTHEPMINSAPMKDTKNCNLFGHIHGLQMVKLYGLNVGVDSHNYKPISIETVEFYLNGILNFYDKNVFE